MCTISITCETFNWAESEREEAACSHAEHYSAHFTQPSLILLQQHSSHRDLGSLKHALITQLHPSAVSTFACLLEERREEEESHEC